MTSLFHRAFGRAISNTLRSRPLTCTRLSHSLITHREPASPIVQLVKDRSRMQLRFFSSKPRPQNLKPPSRPYPHRQVPNRPPRRPFLGFLDRISENALFWGIITINGVVFVMWTMSTQRLKIDKNPYSYQWMINNFSSSWRNFSSGRIWTMITSCFSHENIPHILFNGFTFFFMAKPVMSILGSRNFLFLYLGSGIIANVASMSWTNLMRGRDNGSYGASAAIYGVISFLACVAPKMTFQLYGLIPIPAWLAVSGIFAYDTYSALNDSRKGIDTIGHVAGLMGGVVYFLARRFRIL
ncbi:RHOMBOID-like protein 12, mitochondrial [Hypsizygus marmoreus]|uniref:RHOMBOID-like protein 12, mitochondrial n=1 Tax=Hypsizygus marmoreus TaxID=39966 RepID=A0A369JN56_HYPMA|nr:RHOMBOID-like protein 12, mitochondrial [Hypsizygus marmoreus]